MPIQKYSAKETILLNAQQVKQQRGVQQTLCLARLRLELNKKTAIIIRLTYPFHCFFCSPLSKPISPKPQNTANFKKLHYLAATKRRHRQDHKNIRTAG